ncbi:MAG: UDP-N-acetylglucosamine 2-epimerase (non-hydrolyzing) [bacterium]|nr:UDP-N-acetylglucosamine 2-epimerase (non-hydrolyzing) [bacterium]
MKILMFIGTRPEAIKMAPVAKALLASENINLQIILTGQHNTMLTEVVELFDLPVTENYKIFTSSPDLTATTCLLLDKASGTLQREKPDMVLVHGDTASCFSTALAAFYEKIPVGHIEAGLRTSTLYEPFPEEGYRTLTDRLTSIHFAPTVSARDNLLAEGISENSIHVTGNTVIDAMMQVLGRNQRIPDSEWARRLNSYGSDKLHEVINSPAQKLLVTCHRKESIPDGITNICLALKSIAASGTQVIFPVHHNPNIQQIAQTTLHDCDNIHLLGPLRYDDFLYIVDKCSLIISDSGGLQEEMPALGKPLLVLRSLTERPEINKHPGVRVIGTDCQTLEKTVIDLLASPDELTKMSKADSLFGDGKASEKICKILEKYLHQQTSPKALQ